MLQRIEYDRYGSTDELHLSEIALCMPRGKELRINVKAASVNPVDWKIRNGDVKFMTGMRFPKGMGQDFAGVVDMIGPDVQHMKIGDEVFGAMELKDAASFSPSIITLEDTAAIKPPNLSFGDASTLATAGKTAWGAIVDIGRVRHGSRILVNGCLGSVGRSAVQIANSLGAEVTGVCRASGIEEAYRLGVSNAIDSSVLFTQALPGLFDLVFDTAGNLSTTQCARLLTANGVALHINGGFGKIMRILLTPKNKFVSVKTTSAILQKVGELASAKKLLLPIGRTVGLNKAIAAIAELETTGLPKGKLVILPDVGLPRHGQQSSGSNADD